MARKRIGLRVASQLPLLPLLLLTQGLDAGSHCGVDLAEHDGGSSAGVSRRDPARIPPNGQAAYGATCAVQAA